MDAPATGSSLVLRRSKSAGLNDLKRAQLYAADVEFLNAQIEDLKSFPLEVGDLQWAQLKGVTKSTGQIFIDLASFGASKAAKLVMLTVGYAQDIATGNEVTFRISSRFAGAPIDTFESLTVLSNLEGDFLKAKSTKWRLIHLFEARGKELSQKIQLLNGDIAEAVKSEQNPASDLLMQDLKSIAAIAEEIANDYRFGENELTSKKQFQDGLFAMMFANRHPRMGQMAKDMIGHGGNISPLSNESSLESDENSFLMGLELGMGSGSLKEAVENFVFAFGNGTETAGHVQEITNRIETKYARGGNNQSGGGGRNHTGLVESNQTGENEHNNGTPKRVPDNYMTVSSTSEGPSTLDVPVFQPETNKASEEKKPPPPKKPPPKDGKVAPGEFSPYEQRELLWKLIKLMRAGQPIVPDSELPEPDDQLKELARYLRRKYGSIRDWEFLGLIILVKYTDTGIANWQELKLWLAGHTIDSGFKQLAEQKGDIDFVDDI